ncbi:MAG: hypothetical protein OXC62_13990 [Aestuariivita sp.]|nr:hypothetical protein [Aestuariivita sp.]
MRVKKCAVGSFSAGISATDRLNAGHHALECQHQSDPAHIAPGLSLSDVDVC